MTGCIAEPVDVIDADARGILILYADVADPSHGRRIGVGRQELAVERPTRMEEELTSCLPLVVPS
jgi:hypothetical protein